MSGPLKSLESTILHADTQCTVLDEIASRNELVAVAILILGAIVARLASAGIGALLGFVDRRSARWSTGDTAFISPRLIRVSRAIVFWLILIFAVSYALRVIGVGEISTMLGSLIGFIPQLLVAFTIVVAGHVLGLVASHLLVELSDALQADSIAPRLVYAVCVTVGAVMGLQHIAVDISFVTQLLLILVAIVGVMLAFALGARQHVANLLARRELARLSVGDRVRVGTTEGEIVDVFETGLDVSTSEGITTIPSSLLATSVVVRLSDED